MEPRQPNDSPRPGTAETPLRPGGKFSSNREVAVVQADYLALSNDLEQAQALASSLELQLSGKSNELARFKAIWERTQGDLAKFERDLDAMRRERHALANEAQRAQALEHKCGRLKTAHDELVAKVERLESELAGERAAHFRTQEKLEALAGNGGTAAGGARLHGELRQALEIVREQIDRTLGAPAPSTGPRPKTAALNRIDIEFGG